MSTTTLIKIGKHNYASGLFWQMFSSAAELRQESEKIATQMGFTFWVSRKHQGVVQAGFADITSVPPKTRSIAFELVERITQTGVDINGARGIPQNWIGVFSLPMVEGQWAYLSVRNGAIMGDSDMVGGFDAIVEKIHADGGMAWDTVITDEPSARHFSQFFSGIAHSVFDGSAALQKPTGRNYLQPVKVNNLLKIAKVAIVVAIAFAGMKGLQFYNEQRAAKEAEAARIAAEAEMAGASKVAPPWHTRPLAAAAVAGCRDSFKSVSPGGWQLTSFVCDVDDGTATSSFVSDGMPVWAIMDSAPNAHLVNNQASIPTKVAIRTDETQQRERLLSHSDAIKAFSDLLWRLDITPSISDSPTAPQLPGDKAPPPLPWRIYSFSFDTNMLLPESVIAAIAIPGVRIGKVVYEKDSWRLEGTLYVE